MGCGENGTNDIARQVARLLGEGWSFQEKRTPDGRLCWWSEIWHKDGYGLHLSSDRTGKRLVVSGEWPKDAKGETYRPSSYSHSTDPQAPEITVSKDRPADQIAKDITRRFLPAYLRAWTAMKERARASDEYEAAKGSLIDRLAVIPGMRRYQYPHWGSRKEDRLDFSSGAGGPGRYVHGDVEVFRDNVNIKVNGLDPDTAEKVLRLICESLPST